MCIAYHDQNFCVVESLTNILDEQMRVQHICNNEQQQASILHSLEKGCHFPNTKIKNTLPFILYINGEPYKVEGIKTCLDPNDKKEKFICFTTFIFRITAIRGNCAVLELLKFKHHQSGAACHDGHSCSPCCQVNGEDVEDLVATGVCVTVDASRFNAIQCLPAVSL